MIVIKFLLSTAYILLKIIEKSWILGWRFRIGGIALLYLLKRPAEYLKSKIRIPKSKIYV
jgi:hypothetical protein